MPRATTEVTFPTLTAAARATGLPRHVVSQCKKERPDMILTDGGRIRLAGLCAWLRDRRPEAPTDDALERLRRAKAAREELRLLLDDGRAYPAHEVEERLAGFISAIQQELHRRFLNVVPGEGAHLSARDLKRVLQDHLNRWADYCQARADSIQANLNPTKK